MKVINYKTFKKIIKEYQLGIIDRDHFIIAWEWKQIAQGIKIKRIMKNESN